VDGGCLFYTELSSYYGTKEFATSSQLRLWMTKQAIDWAISHSNCRVTSAN